VRVLVLNFSCTRRLIYATGNKERNLYAHQSFFVSMKIQFQQYLEKFSYTCVRSYFFVIIVVYQWALWFLKRQKSNFRSSRAVYVFGKNANISCVQKNLLCLFSCWKRWQACCKCKRNCQKNDNNKITRKLIFICD